MLSGGEEGRNLLLIRDEKFNLVWRGRELDSQGESVRKSSRVSFPTPFISFYAFLFWSRLQAANFLCTSPTNSTAQTDGKQKTTL